MSPSCTAAWFGQASTFHCVESTRRVEDFVRSVDGYQMLYADMYQTKEEFRSMFHHDLCVDQDDGADAAFCRCFASLPPSPPPQTNNP